MRIYTVCWVIHRKHERRTTFGSPIHQVTNIQAPLLIVHGLRDPYVPPRQSEELVEALRSEGKTFEYVTYPDEGHGILRKANLIDFFGSHGAFPGLVSALSCFSDPIVLE